MASKSINLNELYLQSMPVKLLCGVVIVAAVLVIGYFVAYKAQWEELQGKEDEEAKLRTEFSDKALKAAKLPILKQELEELEKAFVLLLKQLPTEAEVPNLIQELNQAGSNNSLQMTSTTPLATQPDGPVEILPYSIATKGSYSQLSKFAKDVGGLSRIVVLDALNVTMDKDGKLLLGARANTYKAAESIDATKTDAAKAAK